MDQQFIRKNIQKFKFDQKQIHNLELFLDSIKDNMLLSAGISFEEYTYLTNDDDLSYLVEKLSENISDTKTVPILEEILGVLIKQDRNGVIQEYTAGIQEPII
jgi:hypothetical protein